MSTVSRNTTKAPRRSRRTKTPVFDALIMEAQRTSREDLISTDELARELGITEEERVEARARVATWAPDGPDEEDPVKQRGKNTV